MAQNTEVALSANETPNQGGVKGLTPIVVEIDPTDFSADVTTADTILVCTLQPDQKVMDANIRVIGDDAMDGSGTLQLRTNENSTTNNLTAAAAATSSTSIIRNAAPPSIDTDYDTEIELVVAGNSVNSGVTTGATIEVTLLVAEAKT